MLHIFAQPSIFEHYGHSTLLLFYCDIVLSLICSILFGVFKIRYFNLVNRMIYNKL
jgi:hypothetical protein